MLLTFSIIAWARSSEARARGYELRCRGFESLRALRHAISAIKKRTGV